MSRRILTMFLLSLVSACTLPPWTREDCEYGPCGFQTLTGSTARTTSWDESAYALSLTEPGTRLTRREAGSFASCIDIALVGEVEDSADLTLELDFNDDGSIEYSGELPASRWDRRHIQIHGPAGERVVRSYLEKKGTGRASLAVVESRAVACEGASPIKLSDGSLCVEDANCSSDRCRDGRCLSCGPSGCGEGVACKADSECAGGACAAGVCRACAANGTCDPGAQCTLDTHCKSHSCVHGTLSIVTDQPAKDAVCGECTSDAQCNLGKCVQGRCGACGVDSDCASGHECRYADLYVAQHRVCVPAHVPGQLPRSALCEKASDCAGGLACGASPGLAKRCGTACDLSSGDCPDDQTCVGQLDLRPLDGAPDAGAPPILLGELAPTCWSFPKANGCIFDNQCPGARCCGFACVPVDAQCSGFTLPSP
jgi:hypothetical protein